MNKAFTTHFAASTRSVKGTWGEIERTVAEFKLKAWALKKKKSMNKKAPHPTFFLPGYWDPLVLFLQWHFFLLNANINSVYTRLFD